MLQSQYTRKYVSVDIKTRRVFLAFLQKKPSVT